MEFWKVAAACLMLKWLELVFAYTFTVMGDFSFTALLIMTVVWLMGAGVIWVVLGIIFGDLLAEMKRDWNARRD